MISSHATLGAWVCSSIFQLFTNPAKYTIVCVFKRYWLLLNSFLRFIIYVLPSHLASKFFYFLTVLSYFLVLRLFLFSVSHFVLNRLTSPCLSHAAHSRNWFYLPKNKASLWTVFTPQASSPSSTISSATLISGTHDS